MGKAYLIAGASSGIGKACAEVLADEGNTLFLLARREELLEELASKLSGNIVPVVYDLNDLDNIKRVFEVCREREVKLDGMVYSAGINADCPIKANSISLMKEAMTVNCFAFLEMGKTFYSKRYSKDASSIVAVSSIASLLCEKGMAPYSASKAALNAVVKTMAKEFIRRGIRVNAVLPGGVDTPMATEKMAVLDGVDTALEGKTEKKDDPQALGIIPSQIIAENIKFLLSEQSAFTTGELLTIGGGRNY